MGPCTTRLNGAGRTGISTPAVACSYAATTEGAYVSSDSQEER
jgi:hypothetical protein